MITRIADRILIFVRKVVLARLLSPEDFGLFGITLIVLTALENFSQTGFQQALIQRKEDISTYFDAAWTVQVFRGIVLSLIIIGIAPNIAIFFGEPKAVPLLRAVSLSVFLLGMTNIAVINFQKELEFHKQFVYVCSGTIVNFCISVTVAILLRSVWALILGLLAGNFVQMLMSYVLVSYKPKLKFKISKVRELYKYGRWISGGNVVLFFFYNLDNIFIGKILGTTSLGLYQMAYQISNLMSTELSNTIAQVTFPAYSKLQDLLPKLRQAYLQTLQVTAFIAFPFAALIFILAHDFTRIFLGEPWLKIVPVVQILVLWGLSRSISANSGPLFNALGQPATLTKLLFVRLSLLMVLIYPLGTRLGINGVALSVVLSGVVVDPVAVWLVFRIIRCHAWELLRLLFFPVVGTGIMWIGLVVLKMFLLWSVNLPVFLMFIVAGIAIYLGIMAIFEKVFFLGIKPLLINTFSHLK
jgi:O-antigen/teichoic acid export membrane protein